MGISAVELRDLTRCTFVRQVEGHVELPSTNDRALQRARDEELVCPCLIWAERQVGGRGRGSNSWWSAPGALTFSLLLDARADDLPPHRWPLVSLTAGLAVAEALEELLQGPSVELKWPNDVYIQRRKICGILLESPSDRQGLVVLGIGINVNNSHKNAPANVQPTAIALCDIAHREFPLIEVLRRVLEHLADRLEELKTQTDSVLSRWRARCLLTNRIVGVFMASEQIEGRCLGIDPEGALVLETDRGVRRCFAGTVSFFRDE